MSDIKGRIDKARRKAKVKLEMVNYEVEFVSGSVFHIQASRRLETRRIRICLDSITPSDKELVAKCICPAGSTKEIWLYRINIERPEILPIENRVKG